MTEDLKAELAAMSALTRAFQAGVARGGVTPVFPRFRSPFFFQWPPKDDVVVIPSCSGPRYCRGPRV